MFVNLEKAKTCTARFFSENPFSLKELLGYADLTIFREIWSEHSLIYVQKVPPSLGRGGGRRNYEQVN